MESPADEVRVDHNARRNRFEVHLEDRIAVAEYVRRPGVIVLTHTEVPPEARGQDIGGAMARAAATFARAEGLKIVPRCPFMAAYLKRNAAYRDLLQ